MPLTKKEIDKLFGEVTSLLKAADPSGDDSSASSDSSDSSAGGPPSDSASDSSTSASAPDNAPAADSGAADNGPTTPSPDAGGGDPAADQGATAEALESEYMALPPEELQMHLMAVTSAYQKLVAGQDAGGGDPAAAQPAGPADAAPPAPGADAAPPAGDASAGGPPPDLSPAAKSEYKNVLGRLAKAEAAIASVPLLVKQLQDTQAENAELRKTATRFGEAADAIASHLETASGRRKAVTGSTAPMAKSEPATRDVSTMSKSELNKYLVELRKSTPNMKKSESEAILKFVSNSAADPAPIAHLVK